MNYNLKLSYDEGVILENVDFNLNVDYSYNKDRIMRNVSLTCYSSRSVIKYINKLYHLLKRYKSKEKIFLFNDSVIIRLKRPIIESYSIDNNNYTINMNIISDDVHLYNPYEAKLFNRWHKIDKITNNIK